MTSTYVRVKQSLMELLEKDDIKVIALTGPWGIGKTYLWRQIFNEACEIQGKASIALYLSLFGIGTIRDLKLDVIQRALLAHDTTKGLDKAKSGLPNKMTDGSVEYMLLNLARNVTSKKLIVIDDVERKHDSLGIDELLGFINEHSENNGTRFLLLLNTDQMGDSKTAWMTLHEKVIDVEVSLSPTPKEVLDVATKSINYCPHIDEIRSALTALRVCNIRVIHRVFRVVRAISEAVPCADIPPSLWVPCAVLLTVVHYRGADDLPDFDYIKSFRYATSAFTLTTLSEDQRNKLKRWDTLMHALGIEFASSIVLTIDRYLHTGVMAIDDLSAYFEQWRIDDANSGVASRVKSFIDSYRWDQFITEDELITKAKDLIGIAGKMSPGDITDLARVAEKGLRRKDIADDLIEAWVVSAAGRKEYQALTDYSLNSLRSIHPAVAEKIQAMKDDQNPLPSLSETIVKLDNENEGDTKIREVVKRSTVSQYAEALRSLTGEQLRIFCEKHLEWYVKGTNDDFQLGIRNFFDACEEICSQNPNSRISKIINNSLKSRGAGIALPVGARPPLPK